MEVKNLYSLYDKIAKEYAMPFSANNDAQAVRSVGMLLKKEPHVSPVDYAVYQVGDFDPSDGNLGGNESPRLVYDFALIQKKDGE